METLLEALLGNTLVAVPLAAAAWGASRSKARPALAHALWLLVFVKLLTPPIFRMPVLRPAPARTADLAALPAPAANFDIAWIADATPPAAPAAPSQPARRVPVPVLVFFAWALGTAAVLGLALVRTQRFRRMIRDAAPAPSPLPEMLETLGRRLGLGVLPEVRLVPGRLPPLLWAPGGRARILLPEGLRLSPPEWRTLLAHELAHLKRRDHLVRWLEVAVRAAYWWSPLAWWASRGLRDAEERCCDAWVLWALPRRSGDYAHALLETLEFLSSDPPVLSAASSGGSRVPSLARRLTMILNGTPERSLTRSTRFLALTAGLALLPFLPVLAQDPEPKDARRRAEVERERADQQKVEEMKRHALARSGYAAPADGAHDVNHEALLRALKKGMHALQEAGDNDEAKILGMLAERIAREARAHRERFDHMGGRQDAEKLGRAMAEVEQALDAARAQGRDDVRNLEQKAEEIRNALRAQKGARARQEYGYYGDRAGLAGEDRIRDLTEQVNKLATVVERLAERVEKQERSSKGGGGAR
jgi:beta-lactamase regulating signal transducer with metallopeptidase domain